MPVARKIQVFPHLTMDLNLDSYVHSITEIGIKLILYNFMCVCVGGGREREYNIII